MNAVLPKLARIPPDLVAVADYEPLARERLTPAVWAWLSGGAGEETTLADNRAAFERIRLRTRVLVDLAGGHTRISLFGQDLALPVLLGPLAFQTLCHPDGEMASALAAAAHGTGFVLSTQATTTLEDIAREAAGPLWFQLYIQPDRGFTRALVARAEAAGYAALVVTVDAPVAGLRDRERRAGFALPPGVEAVNLRGMTPGPVQPPGSGLLGGPLLAAAPGWRDLTALKAATRLPVLVKGIMTPEDARRALDEGLDGIIVSNHGGRTLDGQPATISVLPAIAAAVERRVPVLLDGGIRRGTDIFKARALGADAVLIGRAYGFALAAAGVLGVSHVLAMLRAELEVAMALTGCRDLAAINAGSLAS